jgi:hypothetical protein
VFVYLDCLRQKFEEFPQFPHEVGLFLGYPPDDVLGFMKHKGQNYKLNGCWKVYGNVDKAKTDFRCYEVCRQYMKTYLQNGGTLRDFRREPSAFRNIRIPNQKCENLYLPDEVRPI